MLYAIAEVPEDGLDAATTLRFAIAAHISACDGREVRLDEIGPDTRARLPP